MTDWMDERERIAALVEDVMALWHATVERMPGEDGDADTIVGRDDDRVSAILLLDDENVEAMVDAESEGALTQWLRDELAEDADRDDDEFDAVDEDLDAAADAWLGADGAAGTTASADEASGDDDEDEDDDDFSIADWADPEADALIDELPD